MLGLSLGDVSNAILNPADPAFWASLGLGGVFVLAFVKGWIVPGYVLEHAETRIREQEVQLAKLTDVFQDKVIPALAKSTDANQAVFDYLMTEEGPRPRPPRKRAL